MKIDQILEKYLTEKEEIWYCDECGWEGPKSSLKQPDNKCPKCGAKPPVVHPKKVEESSIVNVLMTPMRRLFYTVRIKSLELAGWEVYSHGKSPFGDEVLTMKKGNVKKLFGWDNNKREWSEVDKKQ